MKIKKIIVSIFLTAVCALFAFAFTACGSDGSNTPKPVYYKVTFYLNEGFEEDFSVVSVESGRTAADKVPMMINSGFTFDGWCSDEALTQDFDIENTPITANISLYARWKKDYDRAWFLSKLGECAANATSEGVARSKASYNVKLDGASKESFTSDIVDGSVTAGSYNIRLLITAEWFESEILNGEGITVNTETYHVPGADRISATVHYVNADGEYLVYSVIVDKYGYVYGCSKKTDNGATPLYVMSGVTYE